jgi:hypothetical protein
MKIEKSDQPENQTELIAKHANPDSDLELEELKRRFEALGMRLNPPILSRRKAFAPKPILAGDGRSDINTAAIMRGEKSW